jgi:hypothetical protein
MIALFGELTVWKRLWTCRKTDYYLNFPFIDHGNPDSNLESSCAIIITLIKFLSNLL